ncbi:hypothetical protein WA026_019279 [Henosepilachna vigintioctopunctata]|uniref:Uncharacterized protein n=1 Tax=Henosepilachna vigintioctopunctata TaxID=420089 RepID=A0AAW1U3V4_9CUCU
MDLDNPSYFSIAVDIHTDRSRNGNSGSISSSSDCSLSRQLTPPRNKMSFRSFGRSISNNTTESSQFLRGEPRLSDLAPDLAAKTYVQAKFPDQNSKWISVFVFGNGARVG